MRIYIAYKFLGSDKAQLKTSLQHLSDSLEQTGHQTFLFYRDAQRWGEIDIPTNQIINDALAELRKCDVFLAIVQSSQKSEGLLLEAGYAKALGKKMIVAMEKGVQLRFLESLADIFIQFTDIPDLLKRLKSAMGCPPKFNTTP